MQNTSPTKQLAAAIDDAVRCLPTELGNLIVGYAVERPHEWTAVAGKVVVDRKSNEIVEIVSDDRCVPFPWRKLVSAHPFAVASCSRTRTAFTAA